MTHMTSFSIKPSLIAIRLFDLILSKTRFSMHIFIPLRYLAVSPLAGLLITVKNSK